MKKYRTVSIPKPLGDDITRFIEELGYWPSVGSFVREAVVEKLYMERSRWKTLIEEDEGE